MTQLTIGSHEDISQTAFRFVCCRSDSRLFADSFFACRPVGGAGGAGSVKAMFEGLAKRDAAAIKEPLLPGGAMVLMRDGKPIQMTFDAFANRV